MVHFAYVKKAIVSQAKTFNILSLLGTPSEREPLKPLPLVTRLFIPFQDDSTTIQPQQRADSNDDSIEDAEEASTEDQRPGYYFSKTENFQYKYNQCQKL